MKIPAELQGILTSTPDTLHGAVRFVGTRIFAKTLFDYVMNGKPLDEFLADFPDVTREQAESVISWERTRLDAEFDFDLSA